MESKLAREMQNVLGYFLVWIFRSGLLDSEVGRRGFASASVSRRKMLMFAGELGQAERWDGLPQAG